MCSCVYVIYDYVCSIHEGHTHTHPHLTTNSFNQQQKTFFILSHYKLYKPEFFHLHGKTHCESFKLQNRGLEFNLLILICFALLYFRHTQCALIDCKIHLVDSFHVQQVLQHILTKKKKSVETTHVQNDKKIKFYIFDMAWTFPQNLHNWSFLWKREAVAIATALLRTGEIMLQHMQNKISATVKKNVIQLTLQ